MGTPGVTSVTTYQVWCGHTIDTYCTQTAWCSDGKSHAPSLGYQPPSSRHTFSTPGQPLGGFPIVIPV